MKENRFTVQDVVEMTGLSERTVRRHLRNGKLSGMKLGGAWRFTKEDIDAMFIRRELDQDIANKTGERVRRFVHGEHERDAAMHACLIVDVNDADGRTLSAIKEVVSALEGLDANIIPSRDAVRITAIGDLDAIGAFTNVINRLHDN